MKILQVVLLLTAFKLSAQNHSLYMQYPASNEPSLAVNPWNNAQVLLAFNDNVLLKSNDTGKTFEPIKVTSQFGFRGDPVLAWIDSTHYGLVHLANNKKHKWPESFDRIVFQKGDFSASNLTHSVGIGYIKGKMQDKPWLYCEPGQSGNIHITWTSFDKYNSRIKGDSTRIRYVVSANKGKSFSKPLTISRVSGSAIDGDSAMEGATTVKGIDGKLYAAWSGLNKLWFTSANADTKKWQTPEIISAHSNGWSIEVKGAYRANGMPFITAWKQYIVVVWAAQQAGKSSVFYKCYNTATGAWGALQTIRGEWERNVMPAVSVSDRCIAIAYYASTSVKDSPGKTAFRVEYALLDGKNISLGAEAVPQVADDSYFTVPLGQAPFIGDYIAIQQLNQAQGVQGLIAYCKVYGSQGMITGVAVSRFSFKSLF